MYRRMNALIQFKVSPLFCWYNICHHLLLAYLIIMIKLMCSFACSQHFSVLFAVISMRTGSVTYPDPHSGRSTMSQCCKCSSINACVRVYHNNNNNYIVIYTLYKSPIDQECRYFLNCTLTVICTLTEVRCVLGS